MPHYDTCQFYFFFNTTEDAKCQRGSVTHVSAVLIWVSLSLILISQGWQFGLQIVRKKLTKKISKNRKKRNQINK